MKTAWIFQKHETVITLQERIACLRERPLLIAVRVGYDWDRQRFQLSWVDLNIEKVGTKHRVEVESEG
jgi:hypothetical protein